KQVAQLGFNMMLGQFDSFDMIVEEIEMYKAEVESLGRTFDPMSVAVARSVNIVDSEDEHEEAVANRIAARLRTQQHALQSSFQDTREAAEAGTIYGSTDYAAKDVMPSFA
ncbi:MAG: hypothetical protein QGI86_28655, partial [Candidatus Poribacteria bacterium]|nr:hypothetical protein [Candidatus Poribacteria bacterium]